MARFYDFKSNKFALFIGSNYLYTSPFSFLSCPTPVRLTASLNVWSFRPSFPADCDSCWAWRGDGRFSLSKPLYGALKHLGWSLVIGHWSFPVIFFDTLERFLYRCSSSLSFCIPVVLFEGPFAGFFLVGTNTYLHLFALSSGWQAGSHCKCLVDTFYDTITTKREFPPGAILYLGLALIALLTLPVNDFSWK